MRTALKLLLIAGLLSLAPSMRAQTLSAKYSTINACNATGTTCSQTITAAPAGATIIVALFTRVQTLGGGSADCTTGLTDSAGNSYVNARVIQYDTVVHNWVFICYAKNVNNALTSVTATSNAGISDAFDMDIFVVTGLDPISPLDQNVTASVAGCPGACGNSTAPSSGAATTVWAKEYLLCFGTNGSIGNTWSAPTGGFAIQQQSGNHNAELDQTVSAAGAYTAAATLSLSRGWNMTLTTWRAAIQVKGSIMGKNRVKETSLQAKLGRP